MGHPKQEPLLTSETIARPEKFTAVEKWYTAMAPVHQTLGMLLSIFDKGQYQHNRTVYDYWASKGPLRSFQRTARACWPYQATLINARVVPHRDTRDLRSGMVAMMACGDFSNGGNIILPALGKQIALREGGVLFLRGTVLLHAVSEYEGQRFSFVNAIHENLTNLKDNEPPSKPAKKVPRKRKQPEASDTKICPFCSETFKAETGLRQHLGRWYRGTKERDEKHSTQAVIDFYDDRWPAKKPRNK